MLSQVSYALIVVEDNSELREKNKIDTQKYTWELIQSFMPTIIRESKLNVSQIGFMETEIIPYTSTKKKKLERSHFHRSHSLCNRIWYLVIMHVELYKEVLFRHWHQHCYRKEVSGTHLKLYTLNVYHLVTLLLCYCYLFVFY